MNYHLKEQNKDYQIVQQTIRYLSEARSDEVNLAKFARSLNMSERSLIALFKRWCCLTPKEFLQAVSLDRAKKLLERNTSLLHVSNEIGLSSTSRLYDLFVTHKAMPPGIWAQRGEGLEIFWGVAPSPFGFAMIFLTQYGVAGLAFFDEGEEEKSFFDMQKRWQRAKFIRNDEKIQPIAQRIFNKKKWQKDNPVRIILIGTDFELRVWQGLLNIPFGKLTSYGDLAKKIGKPEAARAVGAAIGRNPISFVVPCHRVLGKNGQLTGYHWGVNRKRAMLGWEYGNFARR